jgi:hypothetical protein
MLDNKEGAISCLSTESMSAVQPTAISTSSSTMQRTLPRPCAQLNRRHRTMSSQNIRATTRLKAVPSSKTTRPPNISGQHTTYRPQHILSDNRKTAVSLDLPIAGHCRPTLNCSHDCYAKAGPQAWTNARRKHVWISRYLAGHDISQLILEAGQHTTVRLSGSGDLLPTHVPNILRLAKACPQTQFWGMTRKPEIAKALMRHHLPNLRIMVTVDSSSPAATWRYSGAMCYGPRRQTDPVPRNDPRILTVFPRHCTGRVVGHVPSHPRDCPAVRHTVSGCHACRRCWSWPIHNKERT